MPPLPDLSDLYQRIVDCCNPTPTTTENFQVVTLQFLFTADGLQPQLARLLTTFRPELVSQEITAALMFKIDQIVRRKF